MTLGRLLVAWLPTALWFLAARWAAARLTAGDFPPPGATPLRAGAWTLAEAGVVTLIASLWFDSLGSGGWWLLFLLVGVLATFRHSTLPHRADLLPAALDVVRYMGAGAILAWSLGGD